MTHPGDTTTLLNHSFQSHTQSSSAQRVFPNKVSQSESSPQLLTVLQTSPPPPLPVQHLAATDRGVEARVTVSCSAGQRCGWVRLMKCQMFWKVVKETQTQTDGVELVNRTFVHLNLFFILYLFHWIRITFTNCCEVRQHRTVVKQLPTLPYQAQQFVHFCFLKWAKIKMSDSFQRSSLWDH